MPVVEAPPAALEQYQARQALIVALLVAFRREWAAMGADFETAWAAISPRLLLLMTAAQLRAMAEAEAYVWLAAQQQDIMVEPLGRVNTRAYLARASDERSMRTLLYGAVVRSKETLARGGSLDQALASGGRFLDLVVQTQVADAGRAAESIAITATPALTGYTRMLNPPACARCIILAGKWFRWNDGFERHPRCDCLHVPSAAAESVVAPSAIDPHAYFESLSHEEQDRIFGPVQAQAIRDGANIFQVVNARRGMATADAATTREGANVNQGAFGKAMAEATGQTDRNQRLRNGLDPTPGLHELADVARLSLGRIYEIAGDDRVLAVTLLRRYGYLT